MMSHLGDFIADDDIPAPQDVASQMLLKEELNEVLKTLSDEWFLPDRRSPG